MRQQMGKNNESKMVRDSVIVERVFGWVSDSREKRKIVKKPNFFD